MQQNREEKCTDSSGVSQEGCNAGKRSANVLVYVLETDFQSQYKCLKPLKIQALRYPFSHK